MFFLAYALFEVPSNILLKRLRPSVRYKIFPSTHATKRLPEVDCNPHVYLGAITVGLGGVTDYATLTTVRFLLGAFEAGRDPGVVFVPLS